jgi:hypothetical protein
MPIYQNAAFYEYLGGDLTIEPEEFAMPNEAFTKLMNERKTITDNERNSRGINEAIFGGMVPSGPAVDTGKGFTEQDMQQISPASSPQDAVKRMRERGIDPKLAGLDLGLMPKPKEPVEVSEKDKIDLQIQQERLEQERLKTAEARRKAFGGPENKPRDPDEYNRVYSAANNEKKAAKEDSLSKEEYNPLFSIDKQALNIMAEDPKITSDQARIKAEKRVEENYKAVQLIRESLDYESMSADVYRGSESDQLVNSSGQVNIYHPKFVELVQKSAGKFSPYQILFKVQQHYGAGNAVQ